MVRGFIKRFQPDVLLTVAHGWWHIQARRIAKEFNLPLISFFQDWWPDFPDVPVAFRSGIEREFRRTCAESTVAICVSDGMRQELGAPPNSSVIYPIPSFGRFEPRRSDFMPVMRIAYFGNLYEYGPLIEDALRTLNSSDRVRLEVFGPRPRWTSEVEDYFRSRGLYHGCPPANELVESLRHFQAILVVMSFAASLRRRMITSFPSKMINAMQLGLPVVIWGPEYCSAVRWARRGNAALCVTDANPSALRQVLEKLAASPLEQERLGKSAGEAAARDFNPERIQAQFMGALRRAICSRNA
jgi:glycosyltransferase involved in cell wall biosynthesis